jgi:hypothetical protein
MQVDEKGQQTRFYCSLMSLDLKSACRFQWSQLLDQLCLNPHQFQKYSNLCQLILSPYLAACQWSALLALASLGPALLELAWPGPALSLWVYLTQMTA